MRRRRGQAATEYMMVISVVVIAAVMAGYQFYEPLRAGWQSFSQRFKTHYAEPGGPDI